jgi:hypothetical protein
MLPTRVGPRSTQIRTTVAKPGVRCCLNGVPVPGSLRFPYKVFQAAIESAVSERLLPWDSADRLSQADFSLMRDILALCAIQRG